jgi:hypothetical protein
MKLVTHFVRCSLIAFLQAEHLSDHCALIGRQLLRQVSCAIKKNPPALSDALQTTATFLYVGSLFTSQEPKKP